jgi:hypothetical protein
MNAKKEPRAPQLGPRPNVNPELDSFEALMNAMDAELSRLRTSTQEAKAAATAKTSNADKGKGKAKEDENGHVSEDEDIEAAMEAELKAALEQGNNEDDDDGFGGEGEAMDYNMIKNFLESFKSQGGLSGPVTSLAGRLQPGFQFPRDDL